jgi:transposase InsO family protein
VRFEDQQHNIHGEEKHIYVEGECISADDNGPVTPAGMLGELYWLLFKDKSTGKRWVTYSKTAITTEVFLEEFDNIRRYFEDKEKPIKILRTDFAKQFISPATQRELLRQGIASQNSAPYRHYQNSVERDVQTIIKKASTVLHGQLWLRPDA